jgi:hypothetical protein
VLPSSGVAEAERTAAFLLQGVTARWSSRGDQGARVAPLPLAPGAGPALARFACRRVRGIPEAVAHGLQAWAAGRRPVDLLERIPTARQVLERQSRGRRCVSLLPDEVARRHGDPRHPDGLSFALHDLCHLEKFVAPAHHRGQVGFFRAVHRALAAPPFVALEQKLDDGWRADRDYVIADMNGSAIFLFAALKMKLKMAVRRQLARGRGAAPPVAGPLDAEERAAAAPVMETLIEAMGLGDPGLREAARAVSARRDHPGLAARLLAHFEALGSC